MKLIWDHWHIEASSICTLRCPRCPRTEVSESLLNKQLSLEFFQNQIGQKASKQIKKITFCGNDGDPIYCRDLVDICQWFKINNPGISIIIITNGSHKSSDWWRSLGSVLDKNDEVHWSIDGWDQASNRLYRVNSNWDSIQTGIQAFSAINTDTYRVWASIAFRFNEHMLNQQQSMASQLNFDLYQLTKSTKFGSKYPAAYGLVDQLEPTQTDLVSSGYRYERVNMELSARPRPGLELKEVFLQRAQDLDKHKQYSGVCLIGNKGIFLNSQGHIYPCCWTANRYAHNHEWHQFAQHRFNLNLRTLIEIQQDVFWQTDFLRFDSLECKTKCTPERLQNREHTTEW
jgi:MoaA/NifB/PqqE/SkfB family radical SAM enzyme